MIARVCPKVKSRFRELVKEFDDVFALDNSELSGCVLGSLKLRPKEGEVKPFRAGIYPQSTVDRLETERQIDALLKCDFIERRTSAFSSPSFQVNKANSPEKNVLCLISVNQTKSWSRTAMTSSLSQKS